MLSSDRKGSIKKLLLWLMIPLAAWYVSQNWYQLMLIQGNSMEPNYHHLQLVVLNKHDRQFQHGDVVAFRCEELNSVLVKRIIAVPEDTAQISDGTLLINDHVSQVYPDTGMISFAGVLAESLKLGPEEYLVLGDNLLESKDSRYLEVGIVSEEDMFGKICADS